MAELKWARYTVVTATDTGVLVSRYDVVVVNEANRRAKALPASPPLTVLVVDTLLA